MNSIGLKAVIIAVTIVASLSGAALSWADESPSLGRQVSDKFIRGMVNLSTGWVEIPRQIYEVGTNEGWVSGVFRGPFDGIGMFFARTVAGAMEVATFPVPLPTYHPWLKPVYAWESESASEMVAADRQ